MSRTRSNHIATGKTCRRVDGTGGWRPSRYRLVARIACFCAILSVTAHGGDLPLPRFVSLKTDVAAGRVGPGKNFPIAWQYHWAHLPLKVVAEFEDWRRVEDIDGALTWMHKSLLSGRRYVLLLEDGVVIRRRPDAASDAVARANSRALARLVRCEGAWCQVEVAVPAQVRGWVRAKEIWGIDDQRKTTVP